MKYDHQIVYMSSYLIQVLADLSAFLDTVN